MKKWVFILSVLFLTGCDTEELLNCGKNENVAGVCIDETPPTIDGINDVTLESNETFSLLSGVTASDDMDGDITHLLVITEQINYDVPGTYIVKYEVEDSFLNKTTKIRFVTILPKPTIPGENLLSNGDFSKGLEGYYTFTIDDTANALFSVVNEVLEVEVLSTIEDIWYSPRINVPGITLETNQYYRVSFTAKADHDRYILMQVGELLPADPWYDDFTGDVQKVHRLTSNYQTFEIIFQMKKPTNYNASILFEMGRILDLDPLTTIYIDDITIEKVESGYIPVDQLVIPGRIEAEDYDEMSGIQTEQTGDVDGDENVGWFDAGDYIEYNVEVLESGNYMFLYRVASPSDNNTLSLYIDDVFKDTISITNTSGWQNYTTLQGDVIYLEKGNYRLRLSTETGGININYFNVEKVN